MRDPGSTSRIARALSARCGAESITLLLRLIRLSQKLQVVAVIEKFDIVDDVNRRAGADQCADDQNEISNAGTHEEHISMAADFGNARDARDVCKSLLVRRLGAFRPNMTNWN